MENNYTVFQSVKIPKMEIDNPVFGKYALDSNLFDGVLSNGVPLVRQVEIPGMINNNPKPAENLIVDGTQQELPSQETQDKSIQNKSKTRVNYKPTKNAKEYVEQYADYAIEQMRKYGIPASITLAQGIIESGSGTSRLARRANNHFGIKGTYNGNYQLASDDRPNEKFKKYDDPLQSFEDHSKVLMNKRYQIYLRGLDPTDYRRWAYGIKKGGYATAPNYAQALISTIEANGLDKYDRIGLGK